METETTADLDREQVLKVVLRNEGDSLHTVRGNQRLNLTFSGDVEWDADEIQTRLDRVGALDQSRAEGFAAGLFFGMTMAMEMQLGMGVAGDLDSLYPNVVDELDDNDYEPMSPPDDAIVDGEEIIRELEGVEETQDAIEYLEENNDDIQPYFGFIDAYNDVEGEIFVTTEHDAAEFTVPDGWEAFNEGNGVSFVRK